MLPTEQEIRKLSIDEIFQDRGMQSRVKLDSDTINEYAEEIRSGTVFPPLGVCFDKNAKKFWLWDGWHRLEAYRHNNFLFVDAEITPGDRKTALLLSVGANARHGLRRTNQDKRKAVTILLRLPDWQNAKNVAIAKQCNVTEGFVRKIKKELDQTQNRKSYNTKTHHENQSLPKKEQTSLQAPTAPKQVIRSLVTGEEAVVSITEQIRVVARALATDHRFKAISDLLVATPNGIEVHLRRAKRTEKL